MSIKTDKLIEELSKGIKRTEKKNKKVLISFTEEEYKNIEKVAKKLNTNVSNLIRNTITFTGINKYRIIYQVYIHSINV